MKKVMIATPCNDGKVCLEYALSLCDTIKFCGANGIEICPVFLGNESILQIARNDLIKIAFDAGVDMIWIDADMQWNPSWILELISHEEDIIAGTARKKTDLEETYAVKISDFTLHDNGLMKCEGIGTAFLKMSNRAVDSIYLSSEVFTHHGKECRNVFECGVIDGDFYSEDILLCKKLKRLGFDIWLDPKMTCGHIGNKNYIGDLKQFIERIK
jgi:hypothetical protein